MFQYFWNIYIKFQSPLSDILVQLNVVCFPSVDKLTVLYLMYTTHDAVVTDLFIFSILIHKPLIN